MSLGQTVLIRDASQLPAPPRDWRGELYLDTETRSGDPKRGGLDPHHGDRACGVALTWGDHSTAYYAPVRHRDPRWNLPLEPVVRWARDWMKACSEWVNHHVKFDAHVLWYDGVEPAERMRCTVVEAKFHDSDRSSVGKTYELKQLVADWLGVPPEPADEVRAWLSTGKTKDYADVPADILGRYAANDVLIGRGLHRYLDGKLPAEMAKVRETEVAMTSVLFRMERRGMKPVDDLRLKVEQFTSLKKMLLAQDEIRRLSGCEFTNSADSCHELVCVVLGLPVVQRTETGGPSFDAEALEKYKTHPEVVHSEKNRRIIELISQYREEQTFKGLFVDTFIERRCADGLLHSSYNQVIRTGRMSCSDPNGQQMNERAKRLIVPRAPGRGFLSSDASQVEFRIIAHYIKDPGVIEAYLRDPRTDFHKWVAELCGMKRKPAKNVNFAKAYGGGKGKITRMLAADPDVVAAVSAEVDALGVPPEQRMATMIALTARRAALMYQTYEERLPGIRTTSRQAADLCRIRGYIRNAFGRRRHLPSDRCHVAFNSLVQGCAMDYIKDRMVEVEPWARREFGLELIANVHDELLFEGPAEACADPEVTRRVEEALCVQSVPFRVPFRWESGHSSVSWAEAAE